MANFNDDDLLLDTDVVPDSALMQPIDVLAPAVEEPIIEAVPTTAPLGYPQTVFGPGGAPEAPQGIFGGPVGVDNPGSIMDTPDPATLAAMALGQLTGGTYPTTGLLEQTPLPEAAALPVDAGLSSTFSAAPIEMRQKVGQEQTQSVLPTAGTTTALQGGRQDAAGIKAAADEGALIAGELAALKETADIQRSAAADAHAQRAEALYQQSQQDAAEARKNVARIRNDLAAQPWTSYWGSKDTGDRIMLGLAVGLGALSQAQIGGQNVASTLIGQQIQDYNQNQTLKFKALESQLTQAQNYSLQAQAAIKSQFEVLSAQRQATYDQIDKQLGAVSAKTNTAAARNNAEMQRQKIRAQADKDLFNMEHELDARNTKSFDVFKTMGKVQDPTRFVTSTGEPMNEAQSKNYGATLIMAPAIKTLEDMENQGITNTNSYALSKNALITEGREGFFQQQVDGVRSLMLLDQKINELTAGNQPLQNYYRQARIAFGQKLRTESGASISPTEYLNEFLKYLPSDNTQNNSPSTQAADLEAVRGARRLELQKFRGASQSPTMMWFEGVPNASK